MYATFHGGKPLSVCFVRGSIVAKVSLWFFTRGKFPYSDVSRGETIPFVSRGETVPSYVSLGKGGISRFSKVFLFIEGKLCRGFWKDFTIKPRGCLIPY